MAVLLVFQALTVLVTGEATAGSDWWWPSSRNEWPFLENATLLKGDSLPLLFPQPNGCSYVLLVQYQKAAQVAPGHCQPLGAYNKQRSAPFELVLGLSHHKSGTSQLGCMMWNAAKGAGVPSHVYQVGEGSPESREWQRGRAACFIDRLGLSAFAGD